ncbi:MAG TPA: SDR family oxidoreductase [Pirellulales bacterium]
MKILIIGGTGEISYECLRHLADAGNHCTVFNRGRDPEPLPDGVTRIIGDLSDDASYSQLGREHFDVVCQFKAYTPREGQRDLEVFAGRCGHFIFISTASAYQKPPIHWRITEQTPLANPFWQYSRDKAELERMFLEAHARGRLPATIVRPSLTYRRNFPGTFVSGDDHCWRMLNARPVIIHGDGQTLWTYTHARDFAKLFAPLAGNPAAIGEAFHIMTDTAYTWESLFQAVARTLNVEPNFTFVATRTLVRYNSDWTGPLLGDKAWSTLFDTSKIQHISGAIANPVSLREGFADVLPSFRGRMAKFQPDAKLHTLLDRIVADQQSLGASSV